jgi:hypothetical protein
VCIPIYRNCYVPIKVVTQPGPGPNQITPVNIQVNWREVHVLCDSKGVPIPGPRASEIIKQLSEQLAKADAPKDGAAAVAPAASPHAADAAPAAPAGAQPAPATPAADVQANVPAASAPAATTTQATAPQKQWVWLAQEGVYGFGYQRTDGLWEIDAGSRRTSLQ